MRPTGLRIRKILQVLAVFTSTALFSCVILANPVLDNVAAGQATVQQSPGTTVINQTSQQAILNWQSFNIANGESTHFNQPAGGIALNRINPSQGASQIYGSLTSTGQIILMNPAGVYFGPSAYVNVGGLIATTANISDQNFMNGLYQFSKVDGYSGSIINEGQIIAAQNGLIALVAPGVINNGLIQANLGSIVLASGEAFTFDFTGDQMINFAIDKKTSDRGRDKDGNELLAGVESNGSLIANGGTILVSASDASGVLDHMINLNGVVQAKSVASENGEVIISADPDKGVVRLAGNIDVSGKSAGEIGGHLTVTGHNILLDTGAMIDASGDVGGGNVLIGGNYQGVGPLAHANAVAMMPTAIINADAITSGNGGNVVLWSDYVTNAYGSITAKGGALSGNGGSVETSSKQFLDVNGMRVNTLTTNGVAGEWLLDPSDITINNAATSNMNTGGNPYVPTADSGILNAGDLGNALNLSNITVATTNATGTQAGNITFADAAGNLTTNWTGAFTLTLQADNNILISNAITLDANQVLTLRAGFTNTAGSITTNASILASANNRGTLNMQAGTAGTITVNNTIGTIGQGLAAININSPILVNANITSAGNQTYTGAITPGINLTSLRTTAANSVLTITEPLSWTGTTGLYLYTNTTNGRIVLPSSINAPNGTISLSSSNTPTGINSNISVIANQFTLSSGRWEQIGAVLPTFQVSSFRISGPNNNISFVRALAGDGSGGNPYQLTDVYGLQGIGSSSASLGLSWVLANNIDATATSNWNNGVGFAPIGNSSTTFTGIFDGQNYSINNLTISRPGTNFTGLFTVNDGVLQNFTLAGGSITGGFFVGSIAAYNGNYTSIGVIDNVHSSAAVSGTQYVGGLVGYNLTDSNNTLASTINNSSYSGTINLPSCQYCGGIAGQNYAIISNSINAGTITIAGTSLSNYIGGIAGANIEDGLSLASITNSFNRGAINVTNTDIVGGVLGSKSPLSVLENVGNSGTITVTNTGAALSIGGIIGVGEGAISNVYNEGNIIVNGAVNLGGIVGNTISPIVLTNAYNTGNITSINAAGSSIGGIAGNSTQVFVDSVYNTGYISGTGDALFGSPLGGLSNAYYNSETSGAGVANGGVALTSAQMRLQASYTGFDFGTAWSIVEGQSYPYLQAFYPVAPRAINGAATVDNTIGIAINGALSNLSTGASGAYYMLAGNNVISGINNTISVGNPILVFNTSGPTVGNALIIANAGAINIMPLTANTVAVGGGSITNYSNTTFATALGAISNPNILFSLAGNDLTIGTAAHPNVNLTSAADVTYTANGTITSYGASNFTFSGALNLNNNITTTGSQTYNGAVLLGANITLASNNGNIVFGSTLDRDPTVRNLVVNAGSGAITLTGNVGYGVNNRIGTLALNSTGVTSINGDINAASLATDAGGSTSLGSAIVNTTGNTEFNDAVTFTGAAKAFTAPNITFNNAVAANTSATFTGTAITFLNGLTGNGALAVTGSGGNNTVTVNSGNAQNYSITGTDVGVMTAVAGFTGSLAFTNVQNLIGGMNGNNFVFANNAAITGGINGSNLAANNSVDLTAYLQDVDLDMLTTNDGLLETAASALIANYFNINLVNVNAALDNTLTTPVAKTSDVYITGASAGYVNDPIFFNGFNYFVGTNTSSVTFPNGGVFDAGTNSYTYNGVTIQFTNFGFYYNTSTPTPPTVIVPGEIVNVIQQPPTNASQNNNAPANSGSASSPTWVLAGSTVDQNLTLVTADIINEYDNKQNVKINPYCYTTR